MSSRRGSTLVLLNVDANRLPNRLDGLSLHRTSLDRRAHLQTGLLTLQDKSML